MAKPKSPPDAPLSPEDRLSKLEQSLTLLAGSVGSISGNLDRVLSALGGSAKAPSRDSIDAATPRRQGDWAEDSYYVRIKPHNPKRGCFRRRISVPEIDRMIVGGTGLPGDVPEWIRVSRDVAQKVTRYKQKRNPDSLPVFDIATFEEMEEINRREDQQRMAGLGMAGMLPGDVLREAEQGRLTAKVKEAREAPSTIEGSDRFAGVQPGRRAALEGLEVVAPPPPPSPTAEVFDDDDDDALAPPAPPSHHRRADVEDLAVEAARARLDEDIARAEAIGSGQSTVRSTGK